MGAFIEHGPSNDTSRQVADETLRKLGRLRAASDFELCQWFLCGFRLKVQDVYGFASFREYTERWFGCTGRATEERVRVAERLEELPKLSAAFAAGELVFSAVRELTRVADGETENEWLEVAEGKTASQIERMTSGKKPGDRPSDPTRPGLERKRVTLNLSPSAYALLRQARDVLRKESGGTHLDDDAFIELLASSALSGGGDADETRSRHQIALTVCECCKAATQDAIGEQVPVGPEVVEIAECDAQIIGRVDISAGYERASQVIPPAVRRAVVRRHGGVCAVPGCKHTSCDVHHCDPKSEGGSHDPERLVLLCSTHHAIAPALDQILAPPISQELKSVLHHCYDADTKPFIKARATLNAPISAVRCPFCGISEASTLDHYLPKEIHPFYSVYSKNLVPCCPQCNSHKSTKIVDEQVGVRRFLHPYYDPIPAEGFLKVSVDFAADYFNVVYEVIQPVGLPVNVFHHLRSHFVELDLSDRYRSNALHRLSEDRWGFRRFFAKDNTGLLLVQQLEGLADDLAVEHGPNDWLSVLYRELSESQIFSTGGFEALFSIQ